MSQKKLDLQLYFKQKPVVKIFEEQERGLKKIFKEYADIEKVLQARQPVEVLKLQRDKWCEFCSQTFIVPPETLDLIYKEVIDLSNESLSFEQFKRALVYLAVTQLEIKEFTKDLSKNLPIDDLYNFLTIITGETPGDAPQSSAPFKRQSPKVSVAAKSTTRSAVKKSPSPVAVRSPAPPSPVAQPTKVLQRKTTVKQTSI